MIGMLRRLCLPAFGAAAILLSGGCNILGIIPAKSNNEDVPAQYVPAKDSMLVLRRATALPRARTSILNTWVSP